MYLIFNNLNCYQSHFLYFIYLYIWRKKLYWTFFIVLSLWKDVILRALLGGSAIQPFDKSFTFKIRNVYDVTSGINIHFFMHGYSNVSRNCQLSFLNAGAAFVSCNHQFLYSYSYSSILVFLYWINTPGNRGWSRLRDRTLAVKSRKSRENPLL